MKHGPSIARGNRCDQYSLQTFTGVNHIGVTITVPGVGYVGGALKFTGGTGTIAAAGTYGVDGLGQINLITLTTLGAYTVAPTVAPADADPGDGNAILTAALAGYYALTETITTPDSKSWTGGGIVMTAVDATFDPHVNVDWTRDGSVWIPVRANMTASGMIEHFPTPYQLRIVSTAYGTGAGNVKAYLSSFNEGDRSQGW